MRNNVKGTAVILKDGEDINRAIRRFKNKVEEEYEYEPLRESLKQPISDTFASPLKREIGGRKRRTIKMNRSKTNNIKKTNNRRKTKKINKYKKL